MKQFGLTGYPLGHSFSPKLHKLLFDLEGVEGNYSLYPIAPADFEADFARLRALSGFNLTMPHKQAVVPLLGCMHESAALYQSVNTVANEGGRLVGYNTDCTGFRKALENQDVPLSGSVCVLGAGGVGRMFAIESARAGASVTIAARPSSAQRAKALAAEIADRFGAGARAADIGEIDGRFDLVINATPAGMIPDVEKSPLREGVIANARALFDCIYNPTCTRLMREALDAGVKTVGGVDMFVWQAAQAHTYWNGTTFTAAQIAGVVGKVRALLEGRDS